MYMLNDILKTYLIEHYYSNSIASLINNVGLDSNTIGGYIQRIRLFWKEIFL